MATRALFSAGFPDRRVPTASDAVAVSCGCYASVVPATAVASGTISSGDGSVALADHSLGPATVTGVKDCVSSVPPLQPMSNGGRPLPGSKTVVVTSTKALTVGDCSGAKNTTSALAPYHGASTIDVANCIADDVVVNSFSSQSRTSLLPTTNHRDQNNRPINGVWCTVKDLCRQPIDAVPPASTSLSSSSSFQSDYCNALVGVIWRLVSRRPPVLPTICGLVAAVVFVQYAARSIDRILPHTATAVTATDHVRTSFAMSWLAHAAGLLGPTRSLLFHVNASNRFGSSVDESRANELDEWYRQHMAFEMANIRGAFQLFDEEESSRHQRYQDDMCALEALTKMWASDRPIMCDALKAMTSLNGSMSSTLTLPCNFVARPSDPYPVCADVDHMSSLVTHFIESVSSFVTLAVVSADALLILASAAVLSSAAEKCFLRVLRHRRLLPTKLIYLIPPAVYNAFQPIAGEDDTNSTNRVASAALLTPSDCGDGLTTSRTFRSTSGAVGLQIPVVVTSASKESQKTRRDGGAVIWRDILPTSTTSENHRSQFSETKV